MNDILEEANRRDEEYSLTLNHVMESHIVTKSPWLLRTGWEKIFKGKNMKILNKLTEKLEENSESGRVVYELFKDVEKELMIFLIVVGI